MNDVRGLRLVVCDHNRIFCEALSSVLQVRGHRTLAIVISAADAVAAVATHQPDACLLDLRFPDGSGLDAAQAIRRCQPDTKILMLSCIADPSAISEAKKMGVAGFLRKDLRADTIMDALDVIGAGGTAFGPKYSGQASRSSTSASPHEDPLGALTPRETQVLRRIVAGQSTGQMAREMDLAISTLRSYIQAMGGLTAHQRFRFEDVRQRSRASRHLIDKPKGVPRFENNKYDYVLNNVRQY